MGDQREPVEIFVGYKFYHDDYKCHTKHILQLLTEFYFELDIFRDIWKDKKRVDLFMEDILMYVVHSFIRFMSS